MSCGITVGNGLCACSQALAHTRLVDRIESGTKQAEPKDVHWRVSGERRNETARYVSLPLAIVNWPQQLVLCQVEDTAA